MQGQRGPKSVLIILAAIALLCSLSAPVAFSQNSKAQDPQQAPKDHDKTKPAEAPAPPAAEVEAPAKPKVRTITAFLKLDRSIYPQQIQDTVDFLNKAKASFEKAGFEVQTLRIATQPFPEYTRDLAPAEAFKFLRRLDYLAG